MNAYGYFLGCKYCKSIGKFMGSRMDGGKLHRNLTRNADRE